LKFLYKWQIYLNRKFKKSLNLKYEIHSN
jgi:hypothetical protein